MQPIMNSLSFNVACYQVSCVIEDEALKITIATLTDLPLRGSVGLQRMMAVDSKLQLWVAAVPTAKIETQLRRNEPEALLSQQRDNQLLSRRILELESLYGRLEAQLRQSSDYDLMQLLPRKAEPENRDRKLSFQHAISD
jgi:hypothetical protein